MSASGSGNGSGFDSNDVEILIIDGPGDTTVRPLEGKRRELALALRERIARYEAERKKPQMPEQGPNQPNSPGPQ